MIRVHLSKLYAYGYDVTGYEDKKSESGWYDNLLTEDLLERVGQGDIIMYFDTNESAEDWCEENEYEYELVNQMTITELRKLKLNPIIRSEIYENNMKHWWMLEDKRECYEQLYVGCRYPMRSKIGFDTFADCIADLNNAISSIISTRLLNEQFDDFLNDNN